MEIGSEGGCLPKTSYSILRRAVSTSCPHTRLESGETLSDRMIRRGDCTLLAALRQVWIGIDVSKKTLDAAIWIDGKAKTRREANTSSGFRLLLAWIRRVAGEGAVLHICMEATGDYGFNAGLFFSEQGVSVSVVNPAWVKYYGQSQGRQNKTDRADAKLLAQYGQERSPAQWHLRDPELRLLFRLVRRRRQLSQMITSESNRRECPEAIGEACMCSIKTSLKFLREEIRGIEKQIQELVKSSPELRRRHELLRSMAGDISIFVMLAELPCPQECQDPPSYAACAGVNPAGRRSGESLNQTRMSRGGSSYARSTLTLPMLAARRKMPELAALYDRLKARGKTHKQCLIACIRKFLMIAFAVQKSGKPYVPRLPVEKITAAS